MRADIRARASGAEGISAVAGAGSEPPGIAHTGNVGYILLAHDREIVRMATDFAVRLFFWPVIIGSALLLVLALIAKPSECGAGFLRIGIKRIAFGYIGALFATALYALGDTYIVGISKVDLGHISVDELSSWVPRWSLYMFVLLAPIFIFFMTVVGLPLFALLSRFGWGSLVGVALIAALCSVVYSVYVFSVPYNKWCDSHKVLCMTGALVDFGIPSTLVALGFGLGARLPLLKETQQTSA